MCGINILENKHTKSIGLYITRENKSLRLHTQTWKFTWIFHLLQRLGSQYILRSGACALDHFLDFFFFSFISYSVLLPETLFFILLQLYIQRLEFCFSWKLSTNIKDCNQFLPKNLTLEILLRCLNTVKHELHNPIDKLTDRLTKMHFYIL